jgi:hypothetical protein
MSIFVLQKTIKEYMTMKKLTKSNLNIAIDAIDNLVNDVKVFVNDNGGFLNTSNPECDTMYAYVIDWDIDDVYETKIFAIRVADNNLEILVPNNVNGDFNWYVIGSCGDSVLTAQTILSIAESIEQYIEQ